MLLGYTLRVTLQQNNILHLADSLLFVVMLAKHMQQSHFQDLLFQIFMVFSVRVNI